MPHILGIMWFLALHWNIYLYVYWKYIINNICICCSYNGNVLLYFGKSRDFDNESGGESGGFGRRCYCATEGVDREMESSGNYTQGLYHKLVHLSCYFSSSVE